LKAILAVLGDDFTNRTLSIQIFKPNRWKKFGRFDVVSNFDSKSPKEFERMTKILNYYNLYQKIKKITRYCFSCVLTLTPKITKLSIPETVGAAFWRGLRKTRADNFHSLFFEIQIDLRTFLRLLNIQYWQSESTNILNEFVQISIDFISRKKVESAKIFVETFRVRNTILVFAGSICGTCGMRHLGLSSQQNQLADWLDQPAILICLIALFLTFKNDAF